MGLRLYVHTALLVPLWVPAHCGRGGSQHCVDTHPRHTLRSRPRPSLTVEVADRQQCVDLVLGMWVRASVEWEGVGKQQVRSMGHFKQLLISEPCGEPRHGKGLHKKVSSGDTRVSFY